MLSLTGDPLSLAVLGLGGVVVGLIELALTFVRRFPTWRISAAMAALLAVVGGAAWACGESALLWQPMLLLSGVVVTLLLFRSPTSLAGRPVVQGAGVLLLSAALLGVQLYRIEAEVEGQLLESDVALTQMGDPIDDNSTPALTAATDAGTPLPLFLAASAAPTSDDEARYLRSLALAAKVIQTDRADQSYNCHGWVFTHGRYWVRSRFVETILSENGYRAVTRPAPGDVAVFRNVTGDVTHTGLVRAGERDGRVLIESKWGRFGRFVHTADEHAYRNDKLTYYRTSRGSHVLNGLDSSSPAEATTPTSGPEGALGE